MDKKLSTFNIKSDGLSLSQILFLLLDNFKEILIALILGLLLGLVYFWVTPNKYEAIANIHVAKVANVNIEPPEITVEKLKIPSYYSNDTLSRCMVEGEREPRIFLVERLKPNLVKNSSLITISYREISAEISKNCLQSVISDIQSNQSELLKPVIEIRKNEILKNKLKLEEIDQNLKQFYSAKSMNFDFGDSKFSANSLLLSTLLNKEGEAKDLKTTITNLEILLSEPQTKTAHLAVPIYSSGLPVEPKLRSVLLVSIFGSVILMIGFLMLRKFWLYYGS